MRHLRMLGLCVAAVLAVTAVTASSALAAVKNPTKGLTIFKNCPVHVTEVEGKPVETVQCVFGATESGAGGQFTVGGITVPLSKQIVLQYGIAIVNNGYGEAYAPPTHGVEAIAPTPENVPGEPIAHITAAEQEELGWPETLKYSYAQAQKHGLVKKATETIELAGIPVTNKGNIVFEEGVGLEAPVKIKAGNAWLSALGTVCYIGSDAEPIVQHLTSGETTSPLTSEKLHGFSGELDIFHAGEEAWLTHSVLLDNTYAVPGASCTGPYSAQIAATIDKEFHIPQPAGASVTEVKSTLYVGGKQLVEHRLGL